MRNELPAPSKRSFGFPLPVRALDFFTHPGGSPRAELFSEPFFYASSVYASNGFLAIRADRFDGLPPAENPAAYERIAARLPAGVESFAAYTADREARNLIPRPRADWDARWRPFDDCGVALWKRGPLAPFDFAAGQWRLRKDPIVRVGAASLVPLPLLQLLARLPRSQAWIDNTARGGLVVRFNGGVAVVAPVYGDAVPSPAFSILAPKTDLLGQFNTF